MAEKREDDGGKKKGGGWFKAVLGTMGGLLSGAAVMYFSAYLDKAVKPAKPVSNFRVEHDGRNVHIQNLSPGYTGWWDFGDGTELVPADANHESIDHTYERAGDYNVKLSLTNLLGEENERTAAVHIDDPPETKQPKVLHLEAVRVSPGTGAPATFKVTAQTENAPLCIWCLGGDGPSECVVESTASQERLVKFDKPGAHVITVEAVNDNLIDKAQTVVTLKDGPSGGVGVVLAWTDAGTKVETQTVPCTFYDTWRPDAKNDRCPLRGWEHCADCLADKRKGWVIRDVQVSGANGAKVNLGDQMELPLDAGALGLNGAQNLRLQLAQDRHSIRLVGDLVKPAAQNGGTPPSVVLQGVMTKELRTPMSRPVEVPATLALPTPGQIASETIAMPPPPADWVDLQQRKITLTVSDGANVAAKDAPVPGQTPVVIQGRRCTLVSKLVKDQIRLDLIVAGKPN
ncbi:MAG TPA: PKD domain-containing protein [Gemmataceae bacterium]|nr:PKD domain-containing protein [Gemmataceae bacterium]